jgi:hypothetical protein
MDLGIAMVSPFEMMNRDICDVCYSVVLICWRRAILSRYNVRSRDQGLAPFQHEKS